MKALIGLLVLFSANIYAQIDPAKNYLSLEIDPAPFMLRGYSFSAKFSSKQKPHYTFMGSVFSSTFPDAMMSSSNFEKGWRNMKMETSFALFADYFLKETRTGLHFGPSVFYYRKSVGMVGTADRAEFSTLYPNLRVGYVYKPFRGLGLYINPWFNIGKELNLDSNNRLNGVSFNTDRISYVLAVHIGYKFNF